jgi:hypothetical protein
MHKYSILLFLLLGAWQGVSAQKRGFETPANAFESRKAVTAFGNITLNRSLPSEAAIGEYFTATNPHFTSSQSTLHLLYDKSSPGGRHLTFEQWYNGVPVFNSQVKVNLDKQGNIRSIIDNSYSTAEWNAVDIQTATTSLEALNLETAFIESNPDAGQIEKAITVIAIPGNEPVAARLLETYNAVSGAHRLYLLDKGGQAIYTHDLNSYSGIPVPATALVYNPDPITTAQTIYGGAYIDDGDNSNASLNAERKTVSIVVSLDSNGYNLVNDRFEIKDFSSPTKAPVVSAVPAFNYARNQDGFEDVNTYFHLNTYNTYIEDQGYTGLANFFTQVDPHALDNDDNSMYSKGGGNARLFFGEGGVDDAEDADVVIHEYGHALSDQASPSSNFGSERSAVDEGLGDYLATSYSRSISSYRWQDMFTWDGHNDFWDGRTAASTKHYPEDLDFSINHNGEIWSSTLMQIWEVLGRDVTDKLMFETLYGLGSNMTMIDMAIVFMQSDTTLYNGANGCVIAQKMYNRGFLDSSNVPDCVVLGVADVVSHSQVSITNTEGFAFKNEPVLIQNKAGNGIRQLLLTDASGKVMVNRTNLADNTYFLDGSALPTGIYILKIATAEGVKTEKLVKVSGY